MLSCILKDLIDFFTRKDYELWRTIGDEVVFTYKVRDINNIYQCVDEVSRALEEYNAKIEKNEWPTDISNHNHNLSLKSTMWIAHLSKSNNYSENLYITYQLSKDNIAKFLDYVGPDIDTGFRISKKTAPKRLAISLELALLMIENSEYIFKQQQETNQMNIAKNYIQEDILNKLIIVSMELLNGVWNGRKYPIIWYHNVINDDFFKTFPYDVMTTDTISRDCMYNHSGENNEFSKDFFKKTEETLLKIKVDMRLNDKIKNLQKAIDNGNLTDENKDLKNLEMHAACVCYKEDNGSYEYLVFKRSKTDKFDFAGTKLATNSTTEKSVKMYYSKKLCVELKFEHDDNYVDGETLKVFSLYEYEEDDGRINKGIILLGKITNDIDLNDNMLDNEKFKEKMFISIHDLSLKDEDCVKNFKETLSKCQNFLKKNGD